MATVDDGTWEFSPWSELKPEHVEALTDEARCGYEPFGMRAQFVGRPGYEEREPLAPRISFRLPPEVLAAAQKRADDEGLALSDLAGKALREYLDAAVVRKKSRGS